MKILKGEKRTSMNLFPINFFIKIYFVTWIRIRMRILNTYPDPDPAIQMKTIIRNHPDPNLATDSQLCTVQYKVQPHGIILRNQAKII